MGIITRGGHICTHMYIVVQLKYIYIQNKWKIHAERGWITEDRVIPDVLFHRRKLLFYYEALPLVTWHTDVPVRSLVPCLHVHMYCVYVCHAQECLDINRCKIACVNRFFLHFFSLSSSINCCYYIYICQSGEIIACDSEILEMNK